MSDDRLRLIFTCCHPALAPEAQVAVVAYDRALDLATNAVERDHLQRRRAELVSP